LALYDEIEATKAEEAFRQKFDQTTNSIGERITSLRRLSDAIGQGFAAQQSARVENQLAQEFAQEYRDPELRQRQPQIQARRAQITALDNQEQAQSS
jgi:hypothetical protein